VFRQWWKYQIANSWQENENIGSIQSYETNWNEMSGRYVEFEPDFYIPEEIRIQSKNNKQGSSGRLVCLTGGQDPVEFFRQTCQNTYEAYKYMVSSGAAKEQCRALLPQNIYSECIWTVSMQGLLYFLHQRLKSDAQWEIRQFALAVADLMMPMLEPIKIIE
jgi:thymidylate synthase (FAD)